MMQLAWATGAQPWAMPQLVGAHSADPWAPTKIPGVHIAFGHPYCEHTGQTWTSTTHIDCVGRDFTVWVDGDVVMRNGRYLR